MKIKYIIIWLGILLKTIPSYALNNLWNFDPYAYQYDMSVYATIKINEKIISPTDYTLAAFYNDECRGIATIESTNSSSYYYLRIRSNNSVGENITFKAYNNKTQEIVDASWLETSLVFNADTRIGYPSSPYLIEFKEPTYHNITILPSSNGRVTGGGKIKHGSEAILKAISDEGYEFVNWTNGETNNPYIFKVTEDKQIGAVFQPKKYKLTFVVDGKPVFSDSVRYQSPITLPENPMKEGHTFSGWNNIPQTMPAMDLIVTGHYIINRYAIEYYVDDQAYATDSLEYGSPIALRPEPTKDGYEFSGWSTVPDLMPAHNIRVDGSFVKITGIETNKTDTQLLVDVYLTNGVLIKKGIPFDQINRYLPQGIYLINGQKFIVKP